jgi:hypothetical protein
MPHRPSGAAEFARCISIPHRAHNFLLRSSPRPMLAGRDAQGMPARLDVFSVATKALA